MTRHTASLAHTLLATALALTLAATPGGAQAPAPAPAIPPAATSLEGVPEVTVETTEQQVTRRLLEPAEARQHSLDVQIRDGRLYWRSRDNRLLDARPSGGFLYLLSNEPGHYVRIRQLTDRLAYVEHVDTPAGSITYSGELRIVLGRTGSPP
jgi:hypothetical protein